VDVTVYTTNANGALASDAFEPDSSQCINGVKVRYFSRDFATNYFYSTSLARACEETIKDFDLVYIVSNWCHPFLTACKAAYHTNVPYIISPKASLKRAAWKGSKYVKKIIYHYIFERKLINNAKFLHYSTHLESKDSEWLKIKTPFFVLPDSIDLSEFDELPPLGNFRKKFEIPDESKIILYLGRIEQQKGLDIAFQAFARLLGTHANAFFVVAGPEEDNYLSPLRNLAHSLGISHRVLFTGFLDSRARMEALRDADVFLLTSYSENFGIAIIEAMLSGLPVIVSDQVGISDYIRDLQLGVVVPLKPDLIAEKLELVIGSEEYYKDIAKKASSWVRDTFDPQKIAVKILDKFNNAIK